MQKILIIRFSAIGDIVLTSPVIRCIKLQMKPKLHFLTKKQYMSILTSNPYLDKVIPLQDNLSATCSVLRKENYDLIIDLQSNVRSFWLKLNLFKQSVTVKKENWKKFLYINFGVNKLGGHVVDRYFKTVQNLGIINDFNGLDYFIGSKINIDFDISQNFIAWSVGGSYLQKQLSKQQIVEVSNSILTPIVLLGGPNEKKFGDSIVVSSKNKKIFNFCGQLSLDESAYLIERSRLVLSNDTGLMHIAAAFKKEIVSFWGCTKPSLGFSPYMANEKSVQIVFKPLSRPCSKHGQFCKKTSKGCVKKISSKEIIETILNS